MVNRVVRSTRVPIAELSRPRMRSPSQCPGTARSSTSAGRSVIRSDEALATSTSAGSRYPQSSAGAETGGQLPTQRAAALHIEGLVDGLVRDAHRSIMGEVDPEPVGDLFRTPGL